MKKFKCVHGRQYEVSDEQIRITLLESYINCREKNK